MVRTEREVDKIGVGKLLHTLNNLPTVFPRAAQDRVMNTVSRHGIAMVVLSSYQIGGDFPELVPQPAQAWPLRWHRTLGVRRVLEAPKIPPNS